MTKTEESKTFKIDQNDLIVPANAPKKYKKPHPNCSIEL